MRLHPRTPNRLSLTAAIIGMGFLLAAPAAQALSLRPANTVVTNRVEGAGVPPAVSAIASTPRAIYIGGRFTQVGPRTGPGVGIDRTSGKNEHLPQVGGGAGIVNAAAGDGSGGFYIGGSFTHVGTLPRKNLAHILADRTVDPSFKPNPNDTVRTLAVSGSTLYAGGDFTSIGGEGRASIAALDRTTGAATSWDPHASQEGGPDAPLIVYALRVSGSTVYATGNFTSIGGQPRNSIAALDATTGTATSWDPNPDGDVYALAFSGATVYVGGSFDHIGGQPRNGVAALDATTGAAKGWNPNPDGSVFALAVSGSTVYAGGVFSSIGGRQRRGVAALDATTGAATGWNPSAGPAWVNALAVTGSTVYAAGRFHRIGGQPRNYVAALNATTGTAKSWNPNANSEVYALAISGSTVYAGGGFTSIGGKARHHLAALDPSTGARKSWNPNANGGVYALAVSGSTLYVGGSFDYIGGKPRSGLAAVDTTTGAVKSWNPNPRLFGNDGSVQSLRVSGQSVYVGGSFSRIGGKSRTNLAAVDKGTGAATSWNPRQRGGNVTELAVSGSTVYAGGNFRYFGASWPDATYRNCVAALDKTTGAPTSWNPNVQGGDPTNCVQALRLSGSTLYAGGLFTSIGGQTRHGIGAIDASTGAPTGWDPDAEPLTNQPVVFALAVSGSTVYAGGAFNSIGGEQRNGVAALDAITGAATSWDPNATPTGSSLHGYHIIDALALGPDGSLWAGGGFRGFGAVPQSGIARFKP